MTSTHRRSWSEPSPRPISPRRKRHLSERISSITCPSGQVEHVELGTTVQFDPEVCGCCGLRAQCTQAASRRGRSVSVAATRHAIRSSDACSTPNLEEPCFDSVSASSTRWLISPDLRAGGLDTLESGETSSTSDGQR